MEQASEVGTLRQPLLDRVKERYNEIFLVGRRWHLAEGACIACRDPQQFFEPKPARPNTRRLQYVRSVGIP